MEAHRTLALRRTLIALLVFGVSFGYLEAAVVSYLGDLHEPARQRVYPGREAGEMFPLLTMEQLRAAGPIEVKTQGIELGREAATMVMLAAVALAVAGNAGEWAAAFAIIFGTWDITFYLFLKLLLGWPESLLAWDILFLIPAPWVGPVLAPVLVSAAMISAGTYYLWRASTHAPVRITALSWLGIAAGAAAIFISFVMDYRHIMAGGMPHPFHWGVFAGGLGLGVLSYVRAAVASR